MTANVSIFQRMTRVDSVNFIDITPAGAVARSTPDFDLFMLSARAIDVPAERDRLTRDIAKYEKGLAAAERQLGNEAFLQKAPPQVVEGLKNQEAETRLLLEKARAALANLPKET
jgi:valyl-tRNA synthetase